MLCNQWKLSEWVRCSRAVAPAGVPSDCPRSANTWRLRTSRRKELECNDYERENGTDTGLAGLGYRESQLQN